MLFGLPNLTPNLLRVDVSLPSLCASEEPLGLYPLLVLPGDPLAVNNLIH